MLNYVPITEIEHINYLDYRDLSVNREDIRNYFSEKNGLILSDDLGELLGLPMKSKSPTVQLKAKDKLYFEDSYMPATLISRLKQTGLPLSRTIDSTKADYILCDWPRVGTRPCWQCPDKGCGIVAIQADCMKMLTPSYKDQGDAQQLKLYFDRMKNKFSGWDIYYCYFCENLQSAELYHKTAYKYIHTDSVVQFIKAYTPKPTEEEWSGVLEVLKSADDEQRKLGWNLLQNYNLEDRYADLLEFFCRTRIKSPYGGSYSILSGNKNKACDYILKQLHVDSRKLELAMNDERNYNYNINLYLEGINNPLASSVCKSRMLSVLRTAAIGKILENNSLEFSYLGTTNISLIPKCDEPILENANDVERNLVGRIASELTADDSYEFVRQVLDNFNLQLKINRA